MRIWIRLGFLSSFIFLASLPGVSSDAPAVTPFARSLGGLLWNEMYWIVLFGSITVAGIGWTWSLKRRLDQQAEQLQEELADRSAMEKRLRSNEALFRHIIDNMPVMMYSVHASGAIVFWNRECERVTGYLSEEIVGASDYLAFLYPDPSQRADIAEALKRKGNYYRNWELDITCKDGSHKTISWSSISDFAPIPEWFCWGIGVDITDRKQAEAERRMLEEKVHNLIHLESLGVLAGGIAHDFNNLLMGIMGNAELIKLEYAEGAGSSVFIDEIEKATNAAAMLCKRMLAFSGKGQLSIQSFDLKEVLNQLRTILNAMLPASIEFKVYLPDDPVWIQGDIAQIREVIVNLMTNSIEAIGDREGLISAVLDSMYCDEDYLSETLLHEALLPGEYAYIEISDSGCGMNPEILQKIFDPFFSTKFIGRGLGLPAVMGIIRGHQGTLKVYSETDQGTVFKVLFPLSSQGEMVYRKEDREECWRGAGCILLVDDDENVRLVACRMLEKVGFQVWSTGDGAEAIEFYRKNRQQIVCVLLDLTMPGMSGDQVFLELKKIDPQVRVILSSGYNEHDVVKRFLMEGLCGFIQKPYQRHKLYSTLRGILPE